ncbi:MAG: MATE family efflux transporter [Oscillospiraceae bacterium]|nr:MATE family efflux transporter [Oscillospiraceae bacterium]
MEKAINTSAPAKELSAEEQKLASAPIGKVLAAYAVPGVLSMVVNALYNIVDQIYIGNIVGFLGNGATNVVFPMTVAVMAIAMLFGNGGAAFFSLRLGEQKHDQAKRCVVSSTLAVAIVSIVMTIFVYIFFDPICRLFGATDQILPYAQEYGKIILIGNPMVAVIMVLSGFIRSDGSPKRAMAAMLCGCVLNIILDPIFMLVFDMGIAGAAIATVISQLTGLIITVTYINKFKTIKLTKADIKIDFHILGKVASLGMSSFISQAAMLFLMGLMNNSYVKYGAESIYGSEIPLTAMGITSKLSQVVFSVANGISSGSQPIIGYNYGAGNIARVKKTYLTATGVCAIVMLIGTVILEVFTLPVINLFGSESELYTEFAVKCVRIFMSVLLFNGVQASIVVFFQAIGKPLRSLLLSSLRQIVLLLPCVLFLPLIFEDSLTGLMFSSPVADTTSFIIAVVFFVFQWKKMDNEVLERA